MNTRDKIELPPLPEPFKKAVYATSANTKSVRDGVEMGGYEKEPPLFSDTQMHEYALEAIEAALLAERNALRDTLKIIKDWPVTSPLDMDAHNMAIVAQTALEQGQGGSDAA